MERDTPRLRRAYTDGDGVHSSRAYRMHSPRRRRRDPSPRRRSVLSTAFTLLGAVNHIRQVRQEEVRARRDTSPQRQRQHSMPYGEARISELVRDVQREEREVEDLTSWLAKNAHRREYSATRVEEMIDRLQYHKRNLVEAERRLEHYDTEYGTTSRRTPNTHYARPRYSLPRDRPTDVPITNLFDVFLGAGGSNGITQSHMRQAHAQVFHNFFEGMSNEPGFIFMSSTHPQTSSNFFMHDFFNTQNFTREMPSARTQPKPEQIWTTQEARAIFEGYNEHWNNLASTDPAIPYPARNLDANALLARDTIWAPHVTSVSTWSTEDIVRANASAFYLAIVGFAPIYTDRASRIVMDFDHRGDPTQLQVLADLLKKEKFRWHSDRLGRRNGSEAGLNEALQKSEITRGVFHAIVELSELVASKR